PTLEGGAPFFLPAMHCFSFCNVIIFLAATAEIKTAAEEGKYKPLGILRLVALRCYVIPAD
ncbi:MAG: hypothetical protein IKR81_02115, partial [Victivallales bacterium]|nr:hypothetical protein [Victivallales bacterium]